MSFLSRRPPSPTLPSHRPSYPVSATHRFPCSYSRHLFISFSSLCPDHVLPCPVSSLDLGFFSLRNCSSIIALQNIRLTRYLTGKVQPFRRHYVTPFAKTRLFFPFDSSGCSPASVMLFIFTALHFLHCGLSAKKKFFKFFFFFASLTIIGIKNKISEEGKLHLPGSRSFIKALWPLHRPPLPSMAHYLGLSRREL